MMVTVFIIKIYNMLFIIKSKCLCAEIMKYHIIY